MRGLRIIPVLRNVGVKLKTGTTIQPIKRTFVTSTRNNQHKTSLPTSPKLVPKSLGYQCRHFQATQPTRAIPVPTFLLIFKTANAALAIRTLSNLSLSFLPFALRKNPKTGRPRRFLIFLTTVIPLTGFGILILTGLEQAPHTGRLRFRFMSEEEESELCNSAFSAEIEKYKDKFLSSDRVESLLVFHVASNLIKGLNNDLMTLKSFKNLNNKESIENVANIAEQSVDNMSDKNTNVQVEQKPRPFEIYIIEDDEVFNAFSFGSSKKIVLFTGWLKLINYDEEYLAVTLSHEIAHIIQGHSCESFGFSQVLYMVADTARTLLWFPFLATLGPFLNDYLNSTTQILVEKYASGRYNQKAEKEADIIGLQLMALSGYHPKKAIELWKYLSSINNQSIKVISHENIIDVIEEVSETGDDPPPVIRRLQDFFASHPLEEVRAEYLHDMLPEAEKLYENVIAEGGRAKLFNLILNDYLNRLEEPIEAIKHTEDWITTKFWNFLRYLMGLNPES